MHPVRICKRGLVGTAAATIYVGKGYKGRFDCPEPGCGRTTYQHLSFLGNRKVFCDGVKFIKGYPCNELIVIPGPGMNTRCTLPLKNFRDDHAGECQDTESRRT